MLWRSKDAMNFPSDAIFYSNTHTKKNISNHSRDVAFSQEVPEKVRTRSGEVVETGMKNAIRKHRKGSNRGEQMSC